MPATSCIPVVTGGSVTTHSYVHPFIFLLKFKSAMKFSPGVCEHVASDFSNSVNYPLLYFIPFFTYCFSCSIQKLLFHISFKSYILFHSLGDLAYFTLFLFAEKVNNANKKDYTEQNRKVSGSLCKKLEVKILISKEVISD